MASSTSAKYQQELWEHKGCLVWDDFARQFAVSKDRSAVSEIIRNTGAHETDVQLHFPGLLKRLRDALWADWHLSGPVCDGRRLKIDVVLLTHEVNALEYIDTVFEFKTSIQSDVEQRDIVLQIFDRMGYIFEAQLQRTCCWGVGMDSRHVLFVQCDRKSFPKFSATAPMTLLGPGGKTPGTTFAESTCWRAF